MKKSPAILLVHGWRGSSRKYVELAKTVFAPMGYVCLAVDLLGHGKSGGDIEKVSRRDNLDAVLYAYDALAKNPRVDHKSISAYGASYGAYLLALASRYRKFYALALRAPALYPDRGFSKHHNFVTDAERARFRRMRVMPEQNRALRALTRFTGDVLLIDGWRDDVVPWPTVQNYLRALGNARLTHREIMCADHVLSSKRARQAVDRALAIWFHGLLPKH